MSKFNIPNRLFASGDRVMFSIRLPKKLLEELSQLAKKKGWSTTELIQTALDQYVQWEKMNKKG